MPVGSRSREERRRRGERRFWDRLARRYDGWISTAFGDQYRVFRATMRGHVDSDDRVLEVGCGTGDIALGLAPHVSQVVGVDISPTMVAVAREKLDASGLGNARFPVADAYALPFEDGAFDKVVAVNSLQAMKEPSRAVAEGKRVLRTGGEFVSITYCYVTSGALEVLKLARWVLRYGLPRYWSNFRCTQVRGLFEAAGLAVEECGSVWERPAVVLVRALKVEGTSGPRRTCPTACWRRE
jgi:ubiquinone/menaquinone biosynthesis C-methylase UbiE